MSTSTAVAKILISFDEYVRLKEVEKKYEELKADKGKSTSKLTINKMYASKFNIWGCDSRDILAATFSLIRYFFTGDGLSTTALKNQAIVIPNQSGSGIGSDLVAQSGSGVGIDVLSLEKIAALVAEKLNQPTSSSQQLNFEPVIPNFPIFDRPEPTLATGEDEPTDPPKLYDFTLTKSDLNDRADEKKVLHCVPKRHWPNAIRLIQAFEQNPTSLTYDCSGTIYVDQTAIPESNIYLFMPQLFKKKVSHLPGFADFVAKISDMGLQHLIAYQPKAVKLISTKKVGNGETASFSADPKNDNWWYIGP